MNLHVAESDGAQEKLRGRKRRTPAELIGGMHARSGSASAHRYRSRLTLSSREGNWWHPPLPLPFRQVNFP